MMMVTYIQAPVQMVIMVQFSMVFAAQAPELLMALDVLLKVYSENYPIAPAMEIQAI
jgi:hypothetical protein